MQFQYAGPPGTSVHTAFKFQYSGATGTFSRPSFKFQYAGATSTSACPLRSRNGIHLQQRAKGQG